MTTETIAPTKPKNGCTTATNSVRATNTVLEAEVPCRASYERPHELRREDESRGDKEDRERAVHQSLAMKGAGSSGTGLSAADARSRASLSSVASA